MCGLIGVALCDEDVVNENWGNCINGHRRCPNPSENQCVY